MKRSTRYIPIVSAMVVFVFSISTAQEIIGPPAKKRTPWDYQVRRLQDLSTKRSDVNIPTLKKETILYPDLLPSRVRVNYGRSTRRMPPNKQAVLREWDQSHAGFPEVNTQPYQTEVLFTDRGTRHWLASTKSDLIRLKRQLKRGQEVELFIIRVGATLVSADWEPVLLIESFRIIRSDTQIALGSSAGGN